MNAGVIALGYVGLQSGRLDQWRKFAESILGLERHPSSTDSSLRLRMDTRTFRIAIDAAPVERLAYVGWELASPADMAKIRDRLSEAGCDVIDGTAEMERQRCVQSMIRCTDPAGVEIELFTGQRIEIGPFISPRGTRFVTGHLGVGHVVIFVERRRYQRTVDFYTNVLDFRVSDILHIGNRTATFLRCNPRHHSIALVSNDEGPSLVHLMLEHDDLDGVGFALDAAHTEGYKIKRGLGRHSNDRALSFYVETPSGYDIEIGCNGRLIDDNTWIVNEIAHGTLWGHRVLDDAK